MVIAAIFSRLADLAFPAKPDGPHIIAGVGPGQLAIWTVYPNNDFRVEFWDDGRCKDGYILERTDARMTCQAQGRHAGNPKTPAELLSDPAYALPDNVRRKLALPAPRLANDGPTV